MVVVTSTLGAIDLLVLSQFFHLQNGQSCAPQDVLTYPTSLMRLFSEFWGLLLTVLHRAPPWGHCKGSVCWSPPNGSGQRPHKEDGKKTESVPGHWVAGLIVTASHTLWFPSLVQ